MSGRYKKSNLPFDRLGGVIVVQKRLRTSTNWLSLSPQAKALMDLMHTHWGPEKPVAYGVREAMSKIPCCKTKAMSAFKELENNGFIVMVDESLFDSRSGSKSRTWRLTWVPYNGKAPTNDWEKN